MGVRHTSAFQLQSVPSPGSSMSGNMRPCSYSSLRILQAPLRAPVGSHRLLGSKQIVCLPEVQEWDRAFEEVAVHVGRAKEEGVIVVCDNAVHEA